MPRYYLLSGYLFFIWFLVTLYCLLISSCRIPLIICYWADVEVTNFLSFCFYWNAFISLLLLKDHVSGIEFSIKSYFSFITTFLPIVFWPSMFLRNLLIILLRIPFMWWASLSLLSRFFISGFWAFDYNVYLCGFLSEFCLLGVPLAFWIYIIISFLKFGTFSSITFSNILSKYFSFLFWDLHSVYIGLTNDVPQIP